jgi:hypothetical protein
MGLDKRLSRLRSMKGASKLSLMVLFAVISLLVLLIVMVIFGGKIFISGNHIIEKIKEVLTIEIGG